MERGRLKRGLGLRWRVHWSLGAPQVFPERVFEEGIIPCACRYTNYFATGFSHHGAAYLSRPGEG